jgi:hypothetical protein
VGLHQESDDDQSLDDFYREQFDFSMRVALRLLLYRPIRYPGDLECEHSALYVQLREKLEILTPDQLEQIVAQLDDHLARCGPDLSEDRVLQVGIDHDLVPYVPPLAEDRALRDGIEIYVRLATNPDDTAEAEQWWRENQPPEFSGGGGFGGLVPTVIHVASYIGAAGLGGIVGNRADAAFVAAAKLFRSVCDHWRKRGSTNDSALSEEEAIDAAIAAAMALGYEPLSLKAVSAIQDADNSWLVKLEGRRYQEHSEFLRARVPAGDPSGTTILVFRGWTG